MDPDISFTSIIQLAKDGNVQKLLDIFNVDPDRVFLRDRNHATAMHHAAAMNDVRLLNILLDSFSGAELLSSTDDTLNTPLHWAALHNSSGSVARLVTKGSDTSLKNNAGYTPLQVAVQHNALAALQAFLDAKVDADGRGSGGLTALHIAAVSDRTEAFGMLLAAGAHPCHKCNQGYRPLHIAAAAGSQGVMQLLLAHCTKYGYTKEQLLTFGDNENNSPLHAALSSGNMSAIQLCLEHGARTDVKLGDDSTPLHLLCTQGNLDIIELVFKERPKQALNSLHTIDKQHHCPLHKAAMFNHASVVRFLVDQGAKVDVQDLDDRTPMLLAASRECWDCVGTLLQLGANTKIKDKNGHNIMHLIVLRGGDICQLTKPNMSINEIGSTLPYSENDMSSLLNESDVEGCTPLHYACQEGNLASLKALLQLGVGAYGSHRRQSPLHFAAMYGRYNACRRLLESAQGPRLINEKDETGFTSLHFSAMNGHFKVVQLLLNQGANIHRTNIGQTPLHVAAANGYTKTIKILIETYSQLIDQKDDYGNTPLHLAGSNGQTSVVRLLLDSNSAFLQNNQGLTCFTESVLNKNSEIASTIVNHDRWEEAMKTTYHNGEVFPPLILLVQYLPDVCMEVLTRCQTTSNGDPKDENYWIRYDFKLFQPPLERRRELLRQIKNNSKHDQSKETKHEIDLHGVHGHKLMDAREISLPVLNKMVEFNMVDCLRHPVSIAYLRQKWLAYGWICHFVNMLLFVLNLIPMTYVAVTTNDQEHWEGDGSFYTTSNVSSILQVGVAEFTSVQQGMMITVVVVNALQMCKEFSSLYAQKLWYFTSIDILLGWMMYICSIMYVAPFLTGRALHWQFEVGAVAIFLTWFNVLLLIQKSQASGIYVVMFLQIFKTLLHVVLVFSILIVAFAFAFYVLLKSEESHTFRDPFLAIMQVFAMLLGEIGWQANYLTPYVDGDPHTLHFPVVTILLLLFFILTMPILLINLLIGLAVGDIAEIQSNAELKQLTTQVQQLTSIEANLPTSFLIRMDSSSSTIYPNRHVGRLRSVWAKYASKSSLHVGASEAAKRKSAIDVLQLEMMKHKNRLKELQAASEKQHDLLRLIVQKMEIKSEADDKDEGFGPSSPFSVPTRAINSQ